MSIRNGAIDRSTTLESDERLRRILGTGIGRKRSLVSFLECFIDVGTDREEESSSALTNKGGGGRLGIKFAI